MYLIFFRKNKYGFYFTLAISLVLINLPAVAQKDSLLIKRNIQKELAVNFHYGSIYAHSQDIKNTADANPYGVSLELSRRSVDVGDWNRYGCFSHSGVMFNYLNFNTPILGSSYTLAFMFEPSYRLNNKMDFAIKTRVGLSYMTSPHDSLKNPDNNTYSTNINFYTMVGVGINYKISPHYSVTLAANYMHNSNGGFKQPNRGMNYPGVSIGLMYSIDSNHTPLYKRVKNYDWKSDRTKFDFSVYYSPKQGYDAAWHNRRKYLFGTEGLVSYRVSSINAITGAAEIYYDAAIKTIKENLGDSSSNTFVGLLVGNEFVFKKILFSQQLGFYIQKHTDTYQTIYHQPFSTLYHRWGLRYKLHEHWYIGFNILVHGRVADFIDGRVVYRL